MRSRLSYRRRLNRQMTRPPTEAASNGLWTRWRTVFFAANFDFWPLVPISATRNVNLVLYGRDTYETAAFAKTKARTERVNQIAVDAVVSYVGVSNWRDPREPSARAAAGKRTVARRAVASRVIFASPLIASQFAQSGSIACNFNCAHMTI
jgi:hypothetical protein